MKNSRTRIIEQIENKYLNCGRVLSDAELIHLGPVMNNEYLRAIGKRGKPLDEFGLVMTPFEVEFQKIQKEVKEIGYDISNKLDRKLYNQEINSRLLQWAKKRR